MATRFTKLTAFPPRIAGVVALLFTLASGAFSLAAAPNSAAPSAGAAKSAPAAAGESTDEYPFQYTPLRTLAILSNQTEANVIKRVYIPAEVRLLHDAQTGGLQSMNLAEAALLADGIKDEPAMRRYLTKIDGLETEARTATAGAQNPRDVGKQLLAYLHRGPMSAGYESGQTELTVLLDTGKFNCLSSLLLFNILGERLGLHVRAVEVPGHAFSRVFDGKHWVDVETTNHNGFDRPLDRPILEKLQEKYADTPDKVAAFRYETNSIGLIAMAYFCHGNLLDKSTHYEEALYAKFFALAMDPANRHAGRNAVSEVDRRCRLLIKANRREDALALASRFASVLKNADRATALVKLAYAAPIKTATKPRVGTSETIASESAGIASGAETRPTANPTDLPHLFQLVGQWGATSGAVAESR